MYQGSLLALIWHVSHVVVLEGFPTSFADSEHCRESQDQGPVQSGIEPFDCRLGEITSNSARTSSGDRATFSSSKTYLINCSRTGSIKHLYHLYPWLQPILYAAGTFICALPDISCFQPRACCSQSSFPTLDISLTTVLIRTAPTGALWVSSV